MGSTKQPPRSVTKVPDAKVIAMINDLSTAALMSLLCFNDHLVARCRQSLVNMYESGDLSSKDVIEAWEDDQK